jgi:hypothetical protein
VPEDADEEYMKTAKFLSIFDKVRTRVPIDGNAEVRVEYGDEHFFPLLYLVAAIERNGGAIRVLLEPPRTTCKARDRRVNDIEVSACCRPLEAGCC